MRWLAVCGVMATVLALAACVDKKIDKPKKVTSKKQAPAYKTPELRPVSYMDMIGMLPEAASVKDARTSAASACNGMFARGAHAPFKRENTELWGDKATWRAACEKMSALPADADVAAFYSDHFCAYSVEPEKDGLFTGYYLPQITISAEKTGDYIHPVYGKPEGHSAKKTFPSRRDIEKKGLKGAEIIAWTNDAIALFFLHIQGSGYGVYPDGKQVTLAFSGKNNRPYTSIGKVLIENGTMTKEEMNGRSLKAKLYEDTDAATDVMRHNDSYVFFQLQDGSAVNGAAGAALTAEHAIAVDPIYLPYYTPMLLATDISPDGTKKESFVRFVHSLDTGSAIKGAKRADIFFGGGTAAENYAYHQQYKGELIVFLPRGSKKHCPAPPNDSVLKKL